MKKIILSFFILFGLTGLVFANVSPYYVSSLRRQGIGYTQVKSPLVMRQTPEKTGKVMETLNFDYRGNVSCNVNPTRCQIDDIFAAYSEDKKIALLTTLDETENWSMVCFNQAQTPICGWVEEKDNKFYNWTDFFGIFGKKYGLYLFKDLKKNDKLLYSGPIKQTNTTASIELPRSIYPWLVRGNWVLVKVYDFNNQIKTGWLNYRGDDGKLKVFVKFD